MRWHTSAYGESLAAVTNSDVDAAPDEVLTRRNSHLIFTNPYNLLASYQWGTTATRFRFGNAALRQKGANHLWPIERSATIPDLPQIMDLRDVPLMLPQNEELTIEASTDAAGPAETGAILFLGAPGWSQNFPAHLDRLKTRATVVIVAGGALAWGALAEPAFEVDLLNGVYAVVGANVVAANAYAFRLQFPDQPNVNGRQHRPGGLCQDAIGNSPNAAWNGGFGEWGRFHTFTPPNIQLFGDSAGGTYEVRLDLLYLGEDESLLNQVV